jgi:hypothetical protein
MGTGWPQNQQDLRWPDAGEGDEQPGTRFAGQEHPSGPLPVGRARQPLRGRGRGRGRDAEPPAEPEGDADYDWIRYLGAAGPAQDPNPKLDARPTGSRGDGRQPPPPVTGPAAGRPAGPLPSRSPQVSPRSPERGSGSPRSGLARFGRPAGQPASPVPAAPAALGPAGPPSGPATTRPRVSGVRGPAADPAARPDSAWPDGDQRHDGWPDAPSRPHEMPRTGVVSRPAEGWADMPPGAAGPWGERPWPTGLRRPPVQPDRPRSGPAGPGPGPGAEGRSRSGFHLRGDPATEPAGFAETTRVPSAPGGRIPGRPGGPGGVADRTDWRPQPGDQEDAFEPERAGEAGARSEGPEQQGRRRGRAKRRDKASRKASQLQAQAVEAARPGAPAPVPDRAAGPGRAEISPRLASGARLSAPRGVQPGLSADAGPSTETRPTAALRPPALRPSTDLRTKIEPRRQGGPGPQAEPPATRGRLPIAAAQPESEPPIKADVRVRAEALQRAAVAPRSRPVARPRSSRRPQSSRQKRKRRGILRHPILIVLGVGCVAAAAVGADLVLTHGGRPHAISAPQRLGAYVQEPALAIGMGAATLRRDIVSHSNGEASHVVDAVYEDSTGTAAKNGPLIILFVGGNLSGSAASFINSLTHALPGAFVINPGSLRGQAACVQGPPGHLAECVWADNDTFGVVVSPILSATELGAALRLMRPLVEHVVK